MMNAINLLPESYIRKHARRRMELLCVVLYGVVIAATIGAEQATRVRNQDARERLQAVNARYAAAGRFVESFFRTRKERESLVRDARRLSRLRDTIPRSCILAVLTDAEPEELALSRVEVRTETPRLPVRRDDAGEKPKSGTDKDKDETAKEPEPLPFDVVKIAIAGVAVSNADVARYLTALRNSPLTEKAELLYTQQKEVDGLDCREFEADLTLVNGPRAVDVVRRAMRDIRDGVGGDNDAAPGSEGT